MAVKTSILVFYLTLTRNQKVFQCANYVTLFVVNAAGFALTMVNVFQCRPIGAVFLSDVPAHANCTDIVTLYLSSSPVNIITDLAILLLPMPLLTKMRLPFKQKIILVITFSFGFFVAVVDVVRIAFLQQAAISRSLEVKSVHIQNSGGVDFSCTTRSSPISETNVSIELTAEIWQGMRRYLSCGLSSKSTSRSFVVVFQVSNLWSLVLFRN